MIKEISKINGQSEIYNVIDSLLRESFDNYKESFNEEILDTEKNITIEYENIINEYNKYINRYLEKKYFLEEKETSDINYELWLSNFNLDIYVKKEFVQKNTYVKEIVSEDESYIKFDIDSAIYCILAVNDDEFNLNYNGNDCECRLETGGFYDYQNISKIRNSKKFEPSGEECIGTCLYNDKENDILYYKWITNFNKKEVQLPDNNQIYNPNIYYPDQKNPSNFEPNEKYRCEKILNQYYCQMELYDDDELFFGAERKWFNGNPIVCQWINCTVTSKTPYGGRYNYLDCYVNSYWVNSELGYIGYSDCYKYPNNCWSYYTDCKVYRNDCYKYYKDCYLWSNCYIN